MGKIQIFDCKTQELNKAIKTYQHIILGQNSICWMSNRYSLTTYRDIKNNVGFYVRQCDSVQRLTTWINKHWFKLYNFTILKILQTTNRNSLTVFLKNDRNRHEKYYRRHRLQGVFIGPDPQATHFTMLSFLSYQKSTLY